MAARLPFPPKYQSKRHLVHLNRKVVITLSLRAKLLIPLQIAKSDSGYYIALEARLPNSVAVIARPWWAILL
jgi:hypothetical protein